MPQCGVGGGSSDSTPAGNPPWQNLYKASPLSLGFDAHRALDRREGGREGGREGEREGGREETDQL